ncbi:MAG TPA: SDR family NAD(P)-dependent oxidoreductase [Candidatus Omnitrophota bacterium]|nr:SDR family NAD(P)-dependent oxidoreductase [Candidatus Omnitrophota bacterium]HPB68513.1 SDR family NAD(P)-dependent oxidoreductase [Candidatus Omnitrophota bacterium]HQO58394.1 SDR family NAD(P)-dependent oxidoreductase [Candidatus Omnitrophota bacterium]
MALSQNHNWKEWYRGKTALLTGSTAGIGKEMACILAECGSRLILCGRDQAALASLKSELNQPARQTVLETCCFDLAEGQNVREMCRALQSRYQVDILINNAGFGYMGDFISMPEEIGLSMLKVNMDAVVLLCRSFLPLMQGRPGTGVLNVGSVVSFYTIPGSAVYAATKHFIIGLTDALHQEMLPHGVHVTGLYPGRTYSRFLSRATGGALQQWHSASDPKDVARIGLKGLTENKVRVFTDWPNAAKAFVARMVPIRFFLKIAAYRAVPKEK